MEAELSTLQLEQERFLTEVVPATRDACCKHLQEAQKELAKVFTALCNKEGDMLMVSGGQRCMFDPRQKCLRGTFSVKDFCLTADITVTMSKFQRGQSAQFTAGESDQGLYLLPQLQSASNLCLLAAEELEELGCGDGDSMEHTAAVLHAAWELVRQAREELHHRSQAGFPRSAPPSGVFRPDLGSDLVLEAQLDRGGLVWSAYALGPATAPTVTKSDSEASPEGRAVVGQIVPYQGQWFEVLEVVEHRYEMRQLQAACDAVERVWQLANRTRDHLVAIQHSTAA